MIEKNGKNEIIINKSRFINYLFVLEKKEDVEKFLTEVKEMHKDATHFCYAFIFDSTKRFSDDKEPSGTAGIPLLNVLENKNLNHILTITVRYFGGIKLGAGGLVRAYTKSVTENLEHLNIYEYIDGYVFDISFDYELKDFLEKELKTYVENKYYDNLINYHLCANKKDFVKLNSLFNKYNIEVKNLKEIKITSK